MWTLILYIYAGALASGDSVTLSSVPGFTTQTACTAAGKQTESFVSGSSKSHRFTCVKL